MRSVVEERLGRLVEFSASIPVGVLVTAVVMVALAYVVNVFNVPNPNMLLISGLVICSALFGFPGGITGAVAMMAYTLAFFSTGNDYITFTDENLQKVLVSAVGITVVTLFVSTLRTIVTRSFRRLAQMNRRLEEDNRLLEEASAIDSLTNTRNRFGLRRDFPDYVGSGLCVMMLDIDDFKVLNDVYGHQGGDDALSKVGKLLVDLFGKDSVYRYGGDEFLVICARIDEASFDEKVNAFKRQVEGLAVEGHEGVVHFSAGYVHGTAESQDDLRLMMRQADGNLYQSKNAGKNRVTGTEFSRREAKRLAPREAGNQTRA